MPEPAATLDLGDGKPLPVLIPESEQFANRLRKKICQGDRQALSAKFFEQVFAPLEFRMPLPAFPSAITSRLSSIPLRYEMEAQCRLNGGFTRVLYSRVFHGLQILPALNAERSFCRLRSKKRPARPAGAD